MARNNRVRRGGTEDMDVKKKMRRGDKEDTAVRKRMRKKGMKDSAVKNKGSREGVRDIPYLKCYQEAGMIEVESGVFTHGYEIRPPKFQKAITYSVKKVRECMKEIFSSFGEMSFQFVIRNSAL